MRNVHRRVPLFPGVLDLASLLGKRPRVGNGSGRKVVPVYRSGDVRPRLNVNHVHRAEPDIRLQLPDAQRFVSRLQIGAFFGGGALGDFGNPTRTDGGLGVRDNFTRFFKHCTKQGITATASNWSQKY